MAAHSLSEMQVWNTCFMLTKGTARGSTAACRFTWFASAIGDMGSCVTRQACTLLPPSSSTGCQNVLLNASGVPTTGQPLFTQILTAAVS